MNHPSHQAYEYEGDEAPAHGEEIVSDQVSDEEEDQYQTLGQHGLPWEMWVCVLSQVDRPADLMNFGLACRFFLTLVNTYMIIPSDS